MSLLKTQKSSLILTPEMKQDPLAYHFSGFKDNFQRDAEKLEEYIHIGKIG